MSLNMYLIRKATPDDVIRISEVRTSSVRNNWEKYYSREVLDAWSMPRSIEAIDCHKEEIKSGSEVTWVVEFEGVVEGFVSLVSYKNYVRGLYISPNLVGRGIASRLYDELEKYALDIGLNFLELNSSLIAENFYIKKGYVPIKMIEHALPSSVSMKAIYMKKSFYE